MFIQDSGSFKVGDEIFCENGNHYCEKDCMVEEFKQFGIAGIETEIVEDNEK